MSEYQINPELDITRVRLRELLKQRVPKLSQASKALEEIQIDRILQAFFDVENERVVDGVRRGQIDPQYFAGRVEAQMNMKRFLSNLTNIGEASADALMEVDDWESVLQGSVISKRDMELANG